MKRFALAAAFEGLGLATIITMTVGAFTGMLAGDDWLTRQTAPFSATLVGVFALSWIVSTIGIDYFLAHQRRAKQ